MSLYFRIILLLICSQVLLFFMHIAVLRTVVWLRRSFSPQLSAIKCAIVGNIPLFLMSYLIVASEHMKIHEVLNFILYVFVVYNALAYSYCHVFNMGDTGRRIRILYELSLAGRLRYIDLDSRYGAENILDVRLERLIAMKQVSRYQERFILKSFFLSWIGEIVLKWGYFLRYNVHLKEIIKNASHQEIHTHS